LTFFLGALDVLTNIINLLNPTLFYGVAPKTLTGGFNAPPPIGTQFLWRKKSLV